MALTGLEIFKLLPKTNCKKCGKPTCLAFAMQLAQKRGPVPRLRLVSGSRGKVVIDGKLDDEPWQKCPVASTGQMRELQTARQPIYGTSIKTAWIGNNLYFAIRCQERLGDKPNISTS